MQCSAVGLGWVLTCTVAGVNYGFEPRNPPQPMQLVAPARVQDDEKMPENRLFPVVEHVRMIDRTVTVAAVAERAEGGFLYHA